MTKEQEIAIKRIEKVLKEPYRVIKENANPYATCSIAPKFYDANPYATCSIAPKFYNDKDIEIVLNMLKNLQRENNILKGRRKND